MASRLPGEDFGLCPLSPRLSYLLANPARYSYLLAGLLPDAGLKIYRDSAHGFLFQHHSRIAAATDSFLAAAG
jgi:hypothetical protein